LVALKAGANIQSFFLSNQNFFNIFFGKFLAAFNTFTMNNTSLKADANIQLVFFLNQIKFKEILF